MAQSGNSNFRALILPHLLVNIICTSPILRNKCARHECVHRDHNYGHCVYGVFNKECEAIFSEEF